MSLFNIDKLTKYVFWFSTQVYEARSRLKEEEKKATIGIKYKLTSSYDEYLETGYLLVQSRNSAAYAYMKPHEICSDKDIMSYMHPLDVNAVTKLALQTKGQQGTQVVKFCKILKQRFSMESAETIYTVYDPSQDHLLELSGQELLDSPALLKSLNAEDGLSLGFNLGVTHAKKISQDF